MTRMQPIEHYDALDFLVPANPSKIFGEYRRGESKAESNEVNHRFTTGNWFLIDDFEMMAATVADKDPAYKNISIDEIRWEDVDTVSISESLRIATDGIPEGVEVHDDRAMVAGAPPKISLTTKRVITCSSKVSLSSGDDNTDEKETWIQDLEAGVSSSDKRRGHNNVGAPLDEDDEVEEFFPGNWEAQSDSFAKEDGHYQMCLAPHRVPCCSPLRGAPLAPHRENRKLDIQSLRDTFSSIGCNPMENVLQQQVTPNHEEKARDDAGNEGVYIRKEDVLLGRGKMSFSHTGNHLFRNHIQRHYQEYQGTKSRLEKMQIIKQIISMVEEGGGRFLKCFGESEDDLMAWQPVSSEVAYEKVGHSLRGKKVRPKTSVAKAA